MSVRWIVNAHCWACREPLPPFRADTHRKHLQQKLCRDCYGEIAEGQVPQPPNPPRHKRRR